MSAAAAAPGAEAKLPSTRSQIGLDWLNFFVADVQTAFGPFVAVYLAGRGWGQGAIGLAITVNTAVALASQVPAGWLLDRVANKRMVVAACLACTASGALLIALSSNFYVVMTGEVLNGLTGGAVRTALAAIGLGLVGHRAYHTRVGRNQQFNSFGNALTAAAMGAAGHFLAPGAPFFIAAALCLPAFLALGMIRGGEIDHARTRQAIGLNEKGPARWRDLLKNRVLLIFAACLFLFQFSDASSVPLATERLATGHNPYSVLVTSALVIVPQVVAALLAAWIAARAETWGRKKLLIAAFCALLARTALFAWVSGPWTLVGVQILGGLTAAVIGILTPLVVADCTKRTARYNFALGAVGMISGVGAAISTTAIGYVAESLGFTAAFLTLALIATAGVAVLWAFMPETAHEAQENGG